MAGQLRTCTTYSRSPVQLYVSVACTVKVYVPSVVVVPETTPLDESNVRPAGKLPLVTLNVYGVVPPVTDTVWL
jgi:hypothetical protein